MRLSTLGGVSADVIDCMFCGMLDWLKVPESVRLFVIMTFRRLYDEGR